jgi:hypothetical protein
MNSEDFKKRYKMFAIDVALLIKEGNELLAITVSSIKTTREKTYKS